MIPFSSLQTTFITVLYKLAPIQEKKYSDLIMVLSCPKPSEKQSSKDKK